MCTKAVQRQTQKVKNPVQEDKATPHTIISTAYHTFTYADPNASSFMEELPEVDPAIWADLRLPLPNQKIGGQFPLATNKALIT